MLLEVRGKGWVIKCEWFKRKVDCYEPSLDKIRILVESGENNVEAQQEKQNQKGTEPIQQVIEQHIAQNEENEGSGGENAKVLINYDNVDTVKKQNILEKHTC